MIIAILFALQKTFSKLNGRKIFSKIDLSEAYLKVKVDEECSKYLTIHTHRGLYTLKRLPFGLKVALSLYQQIMEAMWAGLEFAVADLDDIQIKSENTEQRRKYAREVFKRINEFGFKLGSEMGELFWIE